MVIRVLTCLGVDLELPFLRHFVDHYGALGISPDRIHVILNTSDPGSDNLRQAEAMAAEMGLAETWRWIAPYTSETMWAERRALQCAIAVPHDWMINADIDEHHEYPAPLSRITAFCDRWRVNAVQGVMIDRLGPGGTLPPVATDHPLDTQFPVHADLAISLFDRRRGRGLTGTFKLMMHRGAVFPHQGGHRAEWNSRPRYLMGRPLSDLSGMDDPHRRLIYPFRVHHYKWTAHRVAKIEQRIATPGASANGRHFGGQTVNYLERHGRIRLSDVVTRDPAVPVPFHTWKRASVVSRARSFLSNLRPFKD